MNRLRAVFIATCLLIAGMLCPQPRAQSDNGIDPEALIQRILSVDQRQSEEINDVIYEAEYIEGEEKDGEFREKVRFEKRIYVKYVDDTALYHEEYLEYYKDGKLKTDKDRDKEAANRKEDKRKRKTKDVSFSMMGPFQPDNRLLYDIVYQGVTEDMVGGYMCHHFEVTATEEIDSLINGDYYFDAESFHLVRVDFAPAKLVKRTFFRLKEMSMSIVYGPTEEGYWLPRQFDIEGKGKAMFFFGVKFAGAEYYRNPEVNSGIDDEVFEEKDGSDIQNQDSEN